jgi:hypothetical protein
MRYLIWSVLWKLQKVSACASSARYDSEWITGKGTTFYSWLDVPSTASTIEIVKAYRKLSVQLQ